MEAQFLPKDQRSLKPEGTGGGKEIGGLGSNTPLGTANLLLSTYYLLLITYHLLLINSSSNIFININSSSNININSNIYIY